MERFKKLDIKKTIKISLTLLGVALTIFISFFNAIFDFYTFDWQKWLANASLLIGIMIFSLILGNSVGIDIQQEKENGRFQQSCIAYKEIFDKIENIKTYFSQFWLFYKAKKLKEKKIEYLNDRQFDYFVAKTIIEKIDKDELVVGKLGFDENKPFEKLYIKDDIKLKKLNLEQLDIVKSAFNLTLDTFDNSYYLTLFDYNVENLKDVEIAKAIHKKIIRDRRNKMIIKILSFIIISVLFNAITIKELVDSSDMTAVQIALLNLFTRLFAFISSFGSGYATSVINVRDQANAIENKTNILKEFKTCYDNKSFVPETQEQELIRLEKEQLEYLEKNKLNIVRGNEVLDMEILDMNEQK